MRLNEDILQNSSHMFAVSLKEVPILVLGLIFIEITRNYDTENHTENLE